MAFKRMDGSVVLNPVMVEKGTAQVAVPSAFIVQ
jgi:hypothetical protein